MQSTKEDTIMINRRKFVSSLLGIFSTPTVSIVKPASTAIETVVQTHEEMIEQIGAEMRLGMILQSEGIGSNHAISSMRQLGGVVEQVDRILGKSKPTKEDTGIGPLTY
jgi:hypothetical protein